MATGNKKKKRDGVTLQAQTTAANQTRGLTSTQRTVNAATGVNRSYNFNSGGARGSAEVFMQDAIKRTRKASTRAAAKRVAYNSRRRKSNGGSGG